MKKYGASNFLIPVIVRRWSTLRVVFLSLQCTTRKFTHSSKRKSYQLRSQQSSTTYPVSTHNCTWLSKQHCSPDSKKSNPMHLALHLFPIYDMIYVSTSLFASQVITYRVCFAYADSKRHTAWAFIYCKCAFLLLCWVVEGSLHEVVALNLWFSEA